MPKRCHTCPNTRAHSLTQTHRGRKGEVKRYFCLREKQRQRDRGKHDFHHTDGGKLNVFSKTWTEKSMPTLSARYSAQLCLTAHSCKNYTTWLPNMTRGVEGWLGAHMALQEDTCANLSTHVRPLTTPASGDPIPLSRPLLIPVTQRHTQSQTV